MLHRQPLFADVAESHQLELSAVWSAKLSGIGYELSAHGGFGSAACVDVFLYPLGIAVNYCQSPIDCQIKPLLTSEPHWLTGATLRGFLHVSFKLSISPNNRGRIGSLNLSQKNNAATGTTVTLLIDLATDALHTIGQLWSFWRLLVPVWLTDPFCGAGGATACQQYFVIQLRHVLDPAKIYSGSNFALSETPCCTFELLQLNTLY